MKVVLFATLLVLPALSLGSLIGGSQDVDTSRDDVKKAAAFAVQAMNARANSLYSDMLLQIVKATTQVVSGLKYDLTIQLVMSTECRNNGETHTIKDCAYDKTSMRTFEVVVVSQPWLTPPMQLISFNLIDQKPTSNSIEENVVPERLSVDDVMKTVHPQFKEFLAKFKPSYRDDAQELQKRNEIFTKNLRTIKKMQDTERGTAKYGVTEFADLTGDEFRQRKAMPLGILKADPAMKQAALMDVKDTPDSVDWRKKGAVTAVKNQGSCGSCWAFSTTGNIEGQWAIKKGKLVSLSEQELVDCDKVDHGCEGGLPSNAYKQIISLGGLETETAYPYAGRDGTCKFAKSDVVADINSSLALSTDEQQMATWLAANGPISIGINAAAMQFYFGGIAHPWKIFCNPDHLDHGVLIVGYGTEGSKPFWIIKNSWGGSWGEEGYYLVYRGDGVCGLNKMPTSSVVA